MRMLGCSLATSLCILPELPFHNATAVDGLRVLSATQLLKQVTAEQRQFERSLQHKMTVRNLSKSAVRIHWVMPAGEEKPIVIKASHGGEEKPVTLEEGEALEITANGGDTFCMGTSAATKGPLQQRFVSSRNAQSDSLTVVGPCTVTIKEDKTWSSHAGYIPVDMFGKPVSMSFVNECETPRRVVKVPHQGEPQCIANVEAGAKVCCDLNVGDVLRIGKPDESSDGTHVMIDKTGTTERMVLPDPLGTQPGSCYFRGSFRLQTVIKEWDTEKSQDFALGQRGWEENG